MSLYYQDDYVTLYHGDCLTEHREWLEADVLVTDPPYGRAWKQGNLKGHARNDSSAGIANDATTGVRDRALEAWGKARPAIAFGDLMLAPPANTKHVLIYHKDPTSGLRGAIGGIRRDTEAIYLVGKWPSGIGGRSSVFATGQMISGSHGIVAKAGGHPHTKPGDVMGALIGLTAGTIADPFGGGGSTAVAAKLLGRKIITVELEEKYCEIIAKRCAQDVLDIFGGAA
jgi:site-specific DNA-methyltransferase (adenine-specific)